MWHHLLFHFTLFSFAKSAILIAPFFAAYVLPIEQYGELERSLATAPLLAMLFSLGMSGVIAYAIVKQQAWGSVVSALRYLAVLASISAVVAVIGSVFFSDYFSFSMLLVVSMLGLFVAQGGVAAYLKASGLGAYASIMESVVYLGLLFFLVCLWIFESEYFYLSDAVVFYSILTFFVVVALLLLQNKLRCRAGYQYDMSRALRVGFPMMLASSLSLLMLFFPRIFLGYFSSLEVLAHFSLLFRLASIAIVAHQFVVTVFFKNIFSLSFSKLDRVVSAVPLLVLLVASGGFVLLNMLLQGAVLDLGEYKAVGENLHHQIVISVCLFFWSLSALLEGLLFRDHLARSQLIGVALGVVVMLVFVTLSFWLGYEDLMALVLWAWLLGLLTTVAWQLKVLLPLAVESGGFRYLKISIASTLLGFLGCFSLLNTMQ